jgi:hypothetical protein
MRTTDRIIEIGKLKSLENADIGLLANARCLSEGVDVPSLDGIAFIDPKGSQVDIIQAVGRAIRKVRGATTQTKGTIVLPVFIEDGDDAEAQIEASNFKPVWDVLKALRSHDEVLAEHLDQYRTNMAKRSGTTRQTLDDRIIFDLPTTVDPNFSSALRTVLVEASTASWEFWFGLLEVFQEREGNCKVSAKHEEDGFSLGSWVNNQRRRQTRMSNGRIALLNNLGFIWVPFEHDWQTGIQHLRTFIGEYSHSKVPVSFITQGSYKLGQWVSVQRLTKAKLSEERIADLDNLGFIWNPHEENWQIGIQNLKIFVAEKSHARVAQSYILNNGYKLGQWVSWIRSQKDELSKEKSNCPGCFA